MNFNFDARTSRGEIQTHDAYFIKVWKEGNESVFGLGEASPLAGLSIDSTADFEARLIQILTQLNQGEKPENIDIRFYPSIQFALETAHADLQYGGQRKPYPSPFSEGQAIAINGLVWMSDISTMTASFDAKVSAGFDVLKLKIGSHDFDAECKMLETIRRKHLPSKIAIRLDANGAFKADEAASQLKELRRFSIHSIEQPIAVKQWETLSRLCIDSPIPIALDEELIGIDSKTEALTLLQTLRPSYIILKPTLLGGIRAAEDWIRAASAHSIGWWATSALESNIGLNAISQWVSCKNSPLAQGLGTGKLYTNNIPSPLHVEAGNIRYRSSEEWQIPEF